MNSPSSNTEKNPVEESSSHSSVATDILAQPNVATATQHRTDSLNKKTGKTIFVVLPAYNEAEGLPALLEKIEEVFQDNLRRYHIIVVDDASTDNTAALASQASFHMPLTLVQHKVNQNLPGALRTGFLEATQLADEGDIVITMDGDNTHQPGVMNQLIQKVFEGYDVAIASRFVSGARVMGVPGSRVFTAFGARMLFKLIMPIPGVRDYTCGYRAYRVSALRKTMAYYGDEFISEPGFSCMVDVLLKMRRFKFMMCEVPLLLRYDEKAGASKMKVFSTIVESLKLLLKRRFGGY